MFVFDKNFGFTLAEVLITLGIIGVVAAMTLPAIIQKNNNKVVETRLQKFYTTFNQAIQLAESKYGDKKYWYIDAAGVDLDEDGKPILESSEIDKWFVKYLSNFIVVEKKVDAQGTMLYYLPDGSAFQLGIPNENASLRDIYFYPGNPEKCKGDLKDISGRCVFSFEYIPTLNTQAWKYHYNKGLEPAKYKWDGSYNSLLNDSERGCANGGHYRGTYCTALIQYNGWKIPDDYPLKVK